MRVDGFCPSFSLHLDPSKINLVLNAELGLIVGVSESRDSTKMSDVSHV